MTHLQRFAAVVSGVIVVVGIAMLTRVPVQLAQEGDALIRLSWRLEGLSVEDCRTRSAEELAALPAHMRSPAACIGEIADYELLVRLGDATVIADTVGPAGARRDRPIYVLLDLPVDAGVHEASVAFSALVPDSYDGDEPTEYRWDGTLRLESGDIALITLDDDTSRFVTRTPRSGM